MGSWAQAPTRPADFHARLYRGEIFTVGPTPQMEALIAFARAFLETELRLDDPTLVHRHHDHPAQAALFARCEAAFSRSPEVRRLWREVFEAAGLDPDKLAHDRLHLRFQPHHEEGTALPRARTTATIAFHRDTWGSNLYAQVNWWAPVYPITAGRTFAVFPALWDTPLDNTTAEFDLRAVIARAQRSGRNAVDADQAIPHPLAPVDPALAQAVVIAPGTAIVFSGAHAHAGVPNHTGLTRISIETRTVWIDDVNEGRGAPNVDGRAPWAFPGLFRRVSDGSALNDLLGVERIVPFEGSSRES